MPLLAALVLLALGACSIPSVLGLMGGGPTIPAGEAFAREGGFAAQAVAGVDDVAMHVHFRRAGETQELALGLSAFHVKSLRRGLAGYVRLGVNVIEWDRVGTDDGAGLLGPTLELGLGPTAGICVSMTIARDLRFNDPDDTFLGMTASLCAVSPRRRP